MEVPYFTDRNIYNVALITWFAYLMKVIGQTESQKGLKRTLSLKTTTENSFKNSKEAIRVCIGL